MYFQSRNCEYVFLHPLHCITAQPNCGGPRSSDNLVFFFLS
uniref:Uncharacterized protein n=1 Tax=Anguilla anguilla TaxID=7936 RepID=A0A0E9UJB3_ANGAN